MMGHLDDLNNYVPLGCLVLPQRREQTEPSQTESRWSPVISLESICDFEAPLMAAVTKLLELKWVRLYYCHDISWTLFRCYLLPQDTRLGFEDRKKRTPITCLEILLSNIFVDRDTWHCHHDSRLTERFDRWATVEPGSLFYHFNQIPSPKPDLDLLTDKYYQEALEDILEDNVPGLKTNLYHYQRKSAGLMLQREAAPQRELDPRLESRTAPDGTTFYYDAFKMEFFRSARYYEASRGGILAETMGLGKTVICLALILATKDLAAHIPPNHALKPTRARLGKLTEMSVSVVHRYSVPWKVEFDRMRHASRLEMTGAEKILESSPATYEIPNEPTRHHRRSFVYVPPPRTMIVSSTTLVVVPRNLFLQWQSEIRKHVDDEGLQVLVMDDAKKVLPAPDELRSFDIILFSRNRFELEDQDGQDGQKRRMTPSKTESYCTCPYIGSSRTRDCTCLKPEMLYNSPLKYVHFKRVIVDEGHFFGNSSSSRSTATSVIDKLLTVDHRWVVSGTPAKDLLGVEVDLSTAEDSWSAPDSKTGREMALQQRKAFSSEDTKGAVESLGLLACHYLKIRPWFGSDDKASWKNYIFRHEEIKPRTKSGYTRTLRRFLEGNVVKTRPEDVERDIELPPLRSTVVKLEPSFYDKVTANLFTLVLAANAVTSERSDTDYLFHPSSHKERKLLITNLRQSAFFWTGFSEDDVKGSMKNGRRYLDKKGTTCTIEDRRLLEDVIQSNELVTQSKGWRSLSRSHELGVFVQAWPDESAEHWAFDDSREPLLVGITQLLDAQAFVNRRLCNSDPGEDLSGAGIKALAPLRLHASPNDTANSSTTTDASDPLPAKELFKMSGIPASSLAGEPQRMKRSASSMKPGSKRRSAMPTTSTDIQSQSSPKVGTSPVICCSRPSEPQVKLPSHLAKSSIIGTASAKLSYLVSQILKHHQSEKILVFYQGENSAYYIAQMLELLDIKHEIYAKSLKASVKSDYVVRFNENAEQRVLLMDVHQAAFGLNLSSASRIYFVNPVCRPSVEAQAIKRAHRIGQTRTVFVETLVLKDSIEEKMLERSKRMTSAEHNNAKDLEDDGGIRVIIQDARVLPIAPQEHSGTGQMAPLDEPQQLWGLPARGHTQKSDYHHEHWMSIRTVDVIRSTEPTVFTNAEENNSLSHKRSLVDTGFELNDNHPSTGARQGQPKKSRVLRISA
ncbi:uncharacterized protein K489DRAFT_110936 [Dissoconium aciculare CBS 342.82]|uniref:Helicase C-terminal domain-containing protein n=1 Tax=Dissoconium aciculare CBS 342.82 TaxID=1314786 RepID=A0A6J3MH92_9PEZI|nr:uncharacterized protein K489DRAFT_110936 [Dissoconium aciculare CBS 342.82]KAF1826262.1 hypothetical protein K489DRAFT_110936 [Dissoconium aciculare CBS 342.82]